MPADPTFGFPPKLREALDDILRPNGPCAFCGDTILGARHRVIDGITERLRAGEYAAYEDYDIAAEDVWVIVMASYEHDKALRQQRRAEKRAQTVR